MISSNRTHATSGHWVRRLVRRLGHTRLWVPKVRSSTRTLANLGPQGEITVTSPLGLIGSYTHGRTNSRDANGPTRLAGTLESTHDRFLKSWACGFASERYVAADRHPTLGQFSGLSVGWPTAGLRGLVRTDGTGRVRGSGNPAGGPRDDRAFRAANPRTHRDPTTCGHRSSGWTSCRQHGWCGCC